MLSSNSLQSNYNISYEDYLHQFHADCSVNYIGSQAIYDPNFIPPAGKIRIAKARLLKNIIQDAIEDEFSTNINFYGLKGMGKNLHINQYLSWMENNQKNLLCSQKINQPEVCIVRVDCANKEMDQFFFAMINNLAQKQNISLNFNDLMLKSTQELWNTFKILIQKITIPIIYYFHQSEFLDPNNISKIYNFAKTQKNFQIISSMNTGMRMYSFNDYSQLDHRIRLDQYSSSELKNITNQRSIMAFETTPDEEAIDLIFNLVSEFDMKVPGSYIRFLRSINPYIQEYKTITPHHLREISQYHFDGFNIDSLQISEFIMETSIEDRLFLDYIINNFQQKDRFFISKNEIHNSFHQSCEELGYTPRGGEFQHRLEKITRSSIILPNHRYSLLNSKVLDKFGTEGNRLQILYYLTIPLEDASDILDFAFGNIEHSNETLAKEYKEKDDDVGSLTLF